MKADRLCVLGGTGFVGRHLVPALAARGCHVRVLSRHPQRARQLLVTPGVELVQADVHDDDQLRKHFADRDGVINLIGILNESRRANNRFREVHVDLPARVVEACLAGGVGRLLHMSALNADTARGTSEYLRTKGEGENRVHVTGQQGIHVTTFRPSVIFGSDDQFLNRFANLLKRTPFIFPLACPHSSFAPVYVGDVVEAFCRSLNDRATYGNQYELCGPRVFSLRQLVTYIAETVGLHRYVLGLNDTLSRLQARVLEWVPGKPFSYDNYLSLQMSSVCKENGFEALGITPQDLTAVAPRCLGRQGYRLRYQEYRRQAGRKG